MPTDEEIIEDILDEFDFYKVQKAMELLEWTWGAGKDAEYPTIGQMRKTARGLLQSLIQSKNAACGTGGFLATKRTIPNDPEGPVYELSFVLTSWSNS